MHFGIVNSEGIKVEYNREEYQLILGVISSPILKEIVISSPYVFHNITEYPLVISMEGLPDFIVEVDKKTAIPFTCELKPSTTFKLVFPHLRHIRQNYLVDYESLQSAYEHTIIYEDNKAAIAMANSGRPTKRTKHVDTRYFLIQLKRV